MTASFKKPENRGAIYPWIIWALGSLYFAYGFFQRVAPSVLVDDLMLEYAAGAAILGNLSAFYYYAYAGLQIPVGILHDRFGPRRVLTVAAVVCGMGSLLFAMAPSLELAYAGRLLVGAGAAFAWVGTLKLASNWFPPHRFAMITGLTLMIGMIGGIIGQAPLALMIDAFGWRETLTASCVIIFIIPLIIGVTVRDGASRQSGPRLYDVLQAALSVLKKGQTWYVAFVGMSLAVLVLAFMGLWGVPFFMEVYGLDRPTAALAATMGLAGQGVGAPLLGWASDTMRRRRLPIIVGMTSATVIFAVLVYGPVLPLPLVYVLMFAMGMSTSCAVIGFAAAKECAPAAAAGVTIACINAFFMTGGALMQPIAGWLLDLYWDGTLVEGARVYGVDVWRIAFAPFAAACALGVLCALKIRETHCRPLEE